MVVAVVVAVMEVVVTSSDRAEGYGRCARSDTSICNISMVCVMSTIFTITDIEQETEGQDLAPSTIIYNNSVVKMISIMMTVMVMVMAMVLVVVVAEAEEAVWWR